MAIHCERCDADIMPEFHTEIDGEYVLLFLSCPSCGEQHLISVTDAPLRKDIEACHQMAEKIWEACPTVQQVEEVQKLYRRNVMRGKELIENSCLISDPLLS